MAETVEDRVLAEILASLVQDGSLTPEEAQTERAKAAVRRTLLYRAGVLNGYMRQLGRNVLAGLPGPIRRLLQRP